LPPELKRRKEKIGEAVAKRRSQNQALRPDHPSRTVSFPGKRVRLLPVLPRNVPSHPLRVRWIPEPQPDATTENRRHLRYAISSETLASSSSLRSSLNASRKTWTFSPPSSTNWPRVLATSVADATSAPAIDSEFPVKKV
jgi:hypothetical protein